jgi:hypothetical protein
MTCLLRLGMVLLLAASAATAEDNESSRRSLKGLKGVHVAVENLSAEVERDGLNETSIQTDVELKLRQAGIRVLTAAEMFAAPGRPILFINVNPKSDARGVGVLYAFFIDVELRQSVQLDRDPSIWPGTAATWNVASIGTVGRSNLRELRDIIKDQVDQFINAYLSVNPKK